MKTFYEMMQILEDDKGLGDEGLEANQDQQVNINQDDQPSESPTDSSEDLKHYMFFSNLSAIKEKVEKLLSMDPKEIDAMLDDGHDWASDHISTSRDDVEEVYNWIVGEKK
jgi:hypothetical protein